VRAKIIPLRKPDPLDDVLARAERIAAASQEAKTISRRMRAQAELIVQAVADALKEN